MSQTTDDPRASAVSSTAILLALSIFSAAPAAARGSFIWVEGEKPAKSTLHRHSWYDSVKREQLSGGDLASHFHREPGEATYQFQVPAAGIYEFWVRANPVQARLSYALNGAPSASIDVTRGAKDTANVAADGKVDLRFLGWVDVGKVTLNKGENTIRFRMDSANNNHGYLDCFVFTNEPFRPRGSLRPDQAAGAGAMALEGDKGWFPFDPKPDRFEPTSGINLRGLNEKVAGENGFIAARGGQFVRNISGEPIRFWAVNGPSGQTRNELRYEAKLLAKYGVNLVRVHRGYFDEAGEIDLSKIKQAIEIVEAMKEEGIYTHFSIYFPLWLRPRPGTPWLDGYDGNQHPFAALFFNKEFQKKYQSWWRALLLMPSETTGRRLIDEPAVAGAEILNEDSYFFWTFDPEKIPDAQMRILEKQFGDWLTKKYGSLKAAFEEWKGQTITRDAPDEGRVSFRPLYKVIQERSPRDRDAAHFLTQSQREFYRDTYQFLRGLGFKGAITASNWTTASPEYLGPLEKYSYTAGDFIDRHGYFSSNEKGEAAEWSMREGHTYSDRSALRFDPEEPGKAKVFAHPVMDVSYDNKPSMISETTFNRPNRYRSEAPLFYAAYGALQDSDAVVHFAFDGSSWSVKPGYFMQPWTLLSPAMMGQFPAAALIYRKGYVDPGELLVDLNLKLQPLYDLKGTPLPQDASLDELRLKQVPKGSTLKTGQVIDPLVHFAGRTNVSFSDKGGPAVLKEPSRFIDRLKKTVMSSTVQLRLDYGKGILTINTPEAQGISGALREAGTAPALSDVSITSGMELGHIVAVSLDDKPLMTSRKILLQAMSEEKPAGFQADSVSTGVKKITRLGQDPWLVRNIEGIVKLKRADASALKATALDFNGEPTKVVGNGTEIKLQPSTLYYLIAP